MWNDLTLKQKAEIIKLSVSNGITDINTIQQLYNNSIEHTFKLGGDEDRDDALFDREKVLNRVPGDLKGTTGIIDAVTQYFSNPDNYVENRLKDYEKFKDLSWEDSNRAWHFVNRHWNDPDLLDLNKRDKVLNLLDRFHQSRAPHYLQHEDAKRIYLGYEPKYGTMKKSEYEPTDGTLDNGHYITYMRDPSFIEDLTMPLYEDLKRRKMGLNYSNMWSDKHIAEVTKKGNAQLKDMPFLNNATLSGGIDPQRGEYASIYDSWDYNMGLKNISGDNIGKWIGGKPFDIYDRYYLDDYYGVKQDIPKGDYYAGYLPEITVTGSRKKADGGHIYDSGSYFGKVLPELEVIGTRPKRPNKKWREYQTKRLNDKIFNTIFPNYWDLLGAPVRAILRPFENTYSWIRDTQPELYYNLLDSTLGPDFMSYATRDQQLLQYGNGGHLYKYGTPKQGMRKLKDFELDFSTLNRAKDKAKQKGRKLRKTIENAVEKAEEATIKAKNTVSKELKEDMQIADALTASAISNITDNPKYLENAKNRLNRLLGIKNTVDYKDYVPLELNPNKTILTNSELASEEDIKQQNEEFLKGLNKEQLKKLQEKLYNAGLLDKSNIDGTYGSNTQDAFNKYNSYKGKWNNDVSATGIDGCAQWVTLKYENATGASSTQNGVTSNAWQMLKNIENSGGAMLYNIYDDVDLNESLTHEEVNKLTEAAIKANPIDYSKLNIGDVVGIYMPSSDQWKTALTEGTTKNTHVGIITGFDSEGEPIVEHNIHGKKKIDPISNISGSTTGKPLIAVAARPAYTGSQVKQLHWDPKKSIYTVDEKYSNAQLEEYMNSMAGISEQIQKLYPNVNMEDAQLAAIAILKRETNFMNNKTSDQSFGSKVKESIGNAVRSLKGMNDDTKSSDLSKLKLNTLSSAERQLLGIYDKDDLENPTKAGAAALMIMARNMDYFNRLSEQYPELGITNNDIYNATVLSYNQGMDKLMSLGFNEKGIAPEELQQLRQLSNPETRIKDVNSSKYKYLGAIGEYLYDNLEEPYIPYAAAANNAINQYIRKNGNYIPSRYDITETDNNYVNQANNGLNNLMDFEFPTTDVPTLQNLLNPTYKFGGHLYDKAGPLNKKNKPVYKYGLIEQTLVEGSGSSNWFKVTSASRKPNEAGNAGKSSAHTYTLKDGSPAALDIVPNGISWNQFFAIMNTPKMRSALAANGFDILNETSAAMMKATNATGPHLHVGKGIKGAAGTGDFYGGNTFGGGYDKNYVPNISDDNYAQSYAGSSRQSEYEPIIIKGNNTSNPWLDYVAKINSIGKEGTNPIFNTPTRPIDTALKKQYLNTAQTDFSNLRASNDETVGTLDPYQAKQAIEYGLGLENNALWNSPYLLFDAHEAANGGHLFDLAGQMLIRDNAVNPVLQYVYGPEYERIVKQKRQSLRKPLKRIGSTQRQYDIKQRSDATNNLRVQRNIRQKQVDSPARRQEEKRKADLAYEQYRNSRQGVLSQATDRVRHPDYDPVKANQVQQRYEQNEIAAQNAYNRRVLEHNILEGMEAIPWPSTVAGSLFNPNTHWYEPGSFFTNLYANDNRGFFNFNQATRDFYDANPEVGGFVNLVGDFLVPGAASKLLKGANRVGKFAVNDIANSYKTMRYELAHPEAQTLGIIPDRFNPFISKRDYENKMSQLSKLKWRINGKSYPVEYDGFSGEMYPLSLDPTSGVGSIHITRFNGTPNQVIPLENGINLRFDPTRGSSNPYAYNALKPFVPTNMEYNVLSNGAGETTKLVVKNKLGTTEADFTRKPGTYANGNGTTETLPPRVEFSNPGLGQTIYIDKDTGQIKVSSPILGREHIGFEGTIGWNPVRPKIRSGLGETLPVEHPIRVAATNYVNDLESRLATKNGLPLATVEGSYRAVMNGLPHTPKDVEFLLPESNLKQMEKLFNVRKMTPKSNGFGYTVEAEEFDKLFGNANGKTADFEVLKNGPNGGAIGNTAWEIYQYLHPEEASKLGKAYRYDVAKNMRSTVAPSYKEGMELPISAEQLYKEYIESGLYKKKYLYDTMGAMPEHDPLKHMFRRNDLELGAEDPAQALKDLTDRIHLEYPGSKTLREQGYNIDYTNVEANKKFLNYYGLPEEYATDPTKMEIIVEQQIHGYQTAKRGTNEAIPGQSGDSWVKKPIEEREEDIRKMNTEAGGGKGYGPGENATNQIGRVNDNTGLSREVEVVRQIPLTVRPEVIKAIKTPEDLVNRIEEIKDLSIMHEWELQGLNSLMTKQETHDFAMQHDLPVFSKGQPYPGGVGNYHANLLMDKDVAFDMRYVGDKKGFEIVKPFVFESKNTADTPWKVTKAYQDKVVQNLVNAAKNNEEYLSDAARMNKIKDIKNKLNRRRNITKASSITAKLIAGAAAGYGIGKGVKYAIQVSPEEINGYIEATKKDLANLRSNNPSPRVMSMYLEVDEADIEKASKKQFAEYKRQALNEAKADSSLLEQELREVLARDKKANKIKDKIKSNKKEGDEEGRNLNISFRD